ncbi:oligosaccharide flippase family protein [Flavobacterium sp. J372]|uniref:oligosaccharide flippase family protein n=1 Tax=Flavobacterium sp. J372 TaxID=2898436 RepID=UPI00215071B7|nr:oligosaccharide flippase family protein [Flavobacterium sp. J372]MCR5861928.1 oligosaccharide flippase family protein [Flavobacterium sp. J372]
MSEQNSYKKIIRASSLFGFVQVGNILIAIVRSKVLALLVGPAGYGIFGLLNSTADLIRMATGFGLETSSVKIISESAQDAEQLQEKASVVLRLTIYTGIIGTLIAIVFSKYFSILVFGDISKTFAIIFIAISILFQQVANGQIAVMQGLQKLSFLAKANLYGNLAGLLITLPLYYIYKFDAIVPSIIIASVLNFGLSGYFYRKIKPGYIQGNIKQTLKGGRDILYFGAMLSISSFLPILSNYIIQVFISNTSTLAVVGLFTISMALINSYVGGIVYGHECRVLSKTCCHKQ